MKRKANTAARLVCAVMALLLLLPLTAGNAVAAGSQDAAVRIMSSNVLFDDKRDTVYRMHCLAETYREYEPDIICLQEARQNQLNALYPLLSDTYSAVSFPGVDITKMYQSILYRSSDFTQTDSGFVRFRDGVIPWGVSWAVLRRDSDGVSFAVMSTHLTIISDTYDPGSRNTVEGVALRKNDCAKIMELVTSLRAEYKSISIFVCGDWNAYCGSEELSQIDSSDFMRDSMTLAAELRNPSVASTHKICRMPASGGGVIDHIYVSRDTADVLTHDIIADGISIQGSDHCPVYIDAILGKGQYQ